jgi:hypothetical protein
MREYEQEIAASLENVKVEDLTLTAKQYQSRGIMLVALGMVPTLFFLAAVLMPSALTVLFRINDGYSLEVLPVMLIVVGVMSVGYGTSNLSRIINAHAYRSLYYAAFLNKEKGDE